MKKNTKSLAELKEELALKEAALQRAYFSDHYEGDLIRKLTNDIEDLNDQIKEMESDD